MKCQQMIVDLIVDEPLKLYVYDDATVMPLRPGYLLKSRLTIGIGRALDVHGISKPISWRTMIWNPSWAR
jgi:hypothetical protein